MKIYVAGPMSGIEDFNYPAFHDMAKKLEAQGHCVMNPAILPKGFSEDDYMDVALAMLRCCDAIIMLKGWQGSMGAKAEYALAEKYDLFIFEEKQYAEIPRIGAMIKE